MPLNVETYCLDGSVVYESVGKGLIASLNHENEHGSFNAVLFGCDSDDKGSDVFLVEGLTTPIQGQELGESWEDYCTDDNQIFYLPPGMRRPFTAEELGFKDPAEYQMIVASHIKSWFPLLFKVEERGRLSVAQYKFNNRPDCL